MYCPASSHAAAPRSERFLHEHGAYQEDEAVVRMTGRFSERTCGNTYMCIFPVVCTNTYMTHMTYMQVYTVHVCHNATSCRSAQEEAANVSPKVSV